MANPEHLKILRKGVKAWNKWRKENPYIEPDLSNTELESIDLSLADLTSANVFFTGLDHANLSGANLMKADISSSELFETNLRAANLSCANLIGTDLARADLFGANLEQANCKTRTYVHASLLGLI